MPTIDQLKPEDLKNPDIFQKIKELADPFVLRMQTKESYFLQEKLGSLLQTSSIANLQPELYKKYQDLMIHLGWTALSMLADEEVLKVLSENYLSVLDDENIDIQNSIEAKMFTKDLFPRNEFRQKMQRALKENKELIGNKTFGDWLIDYSRTFDFRDRDELTPSKYVNENREAQILSESEKNKLKKALQIFDTTLLVTPVMSEPAFSITVRAMIKAGTIKEQINPALLQTPPVKTSPKPVLKVEEKKPEVRTMKQDIEKTKRQPIPPKPESKARNNIVDLSGK